MSFDKIDLIKIWNRQAPSDNTKAYLNSLSAQVESSLTALAEKEETSVLSVGKKKSTYDEVRDQGFRLNGNLLLEDSREKQENEDDSHENDMYDESDD